MYEIYICINMSCHKIVIIIFLYLVSIPFEVVFDLLFSIFFLC